VVHQFFVVRFKSLQSLIVFTLLLIQCLILVLFQSLKNLPLLNGELLFLTGECHRVIPGYFLGSLQVLQRLIPLLFQLTGLRLHFVQPRLCLPMESLFAFEFFVGVAYPFLEQFFVHFQGLVCCYQHLTEHFYIVDHGLFFNACQITGILHGFGIILFS